MTTPKIALLNAQKFEIECLSSDKRVYIIAIIETDLRELKTKLQVPVISSDYSDLAHIFLEDTINTLPEYGDYNLCLETTKTPPFRLLYNISQNELDVLQEYIVDNLAKNLFSLQPHLLGHLFYFSRNDMKNYAYV